MKFLVQDYHSDLALEFETIAALHKKGLGQCLVFEPYQRWRR